MDERRGSDATHNFEQVVLPHLNAAYNLARWLVRDPRDAEDVVQESFLRAFKFFAGYHGGDPRAWLLAIVRNTAYSLLQKSRSGELTEEFDEEIHTSGPAQNDAETSFLQSVDARALRDALEELPVTSREFLVLRELEGMSYKQISASDGRPHRHGNVGISLAVAQN